MSLASDNAARWGRAKLTRGPELTKVARRLVEQKPRYKTVEAKTGVPWFVIAVIHERESSGLFSTSLAQGDPWNRVSVHVPRGRGPFSSWEAAAVDALVNCAPFAASNKDWSVGGTLALLERYNGLGYANRGLPSPYIWSGTDQYTKGKYVADGKFDANVVDKQLGCAGLIKAMQALDSSVKFAGEASPAPAKVPANDNTPAPNGGWAAFFSALAGLFKRKAA